MPTGRVNISGRVTNTDGKTNVFQFQTKMKIAAQAIFIFVWNWNTFVFPSVLVTRPDMFTLPVGIYQLTHTAFTNHVALSMAGVVLTTVPSLLIFALLQRRFVHALTGAIKG